MTANEIKATILQSLTNAAATYDATDSLEARLVADEFTDNDDPTFERDCYYSDAAEHSF